MGAVEAQDGQRDGAVGLAQQIVFAIEHRSAGGAKLAWDECQARRRECEAWVAARLREWAAREHDELAPAIKVR